MTLYCENKENNLDRKFKKNIEPIIQETNQQTKLLLEIKKF